MSAQTGCITLAGAASLIALSTGAEAATCSYQNAHGRSFPIAGTSTTTIQGQSACTVDMSNYATLCPSNPGTTDATGITSTGYAICEESYAKAMSDAAYFFGTSTNSTQTYLVTIASGTYDYSFEAYPLSGQHGAIDVSDIVPAGTGCIKNTAFSSGQTLSGSGCLVIEGAGSTNTTLVTGSYSSEVYGSYASHVVVEGVTFVENDLTETQGTIVPAPNGVGTTTIGGGTFATLTLDIAPGFPTPQSLFAFNCIYNTEQTNGSNGCTSTATAPYATSSIWFRAYANSSPEEPVASTSNVPNSGNDNGQVAWGYPYSTTGTQIAYEPPVQLSNTSTWTLVLSLPLSEQVVPNAVQASGNLVCLKVDGPGSFFFVGGTDIIFEGVTWVGGTRGVFRGVNGSTNGFPYGAQVYNSILQPNTINGTLACLSQGGGLQFGQPSDPPIYGNVVYNVTATSTGDDSIVFFNDIGTGSTQSVVEQTTITGSNDRFLALAEDPTRILSTNPGCPGVGSATGTTGSNGTTITLLPCTSPVQVDTFTEQHISGCDPLLFRASEVNPSASQCPIYYSP